MYSDMLIGIMISRGDDLGSICGMAQHNTNEETIAVPLQNSNGMGGVQFRLWGSVLVMHGQSLHD